MSVTWPVGVSLDQTRRRETAAAQPATASRAQWTAESPSARRRSAVRTPSRVVATDLTGRRPSAVVARSSGERACRGNWRRSGVYFAPSGCSFPFWATFLSIFDMRARREPKSAPRRPVWARPVHPCRRRPRCRRLSGPRRRSQVPAGARRSLRPPEGSPVRPTARRLRPTARRRPRPGHPLASLRLPPVQEEHAGSQRTHSDHTVQ